MRLLALGQAWADAGGRVEAIIGAPESLIERYRHEGFQVRSIGSAGFGRIGPDLGALLRAETTSVAAVDLHELDPRDLRDLGDAAARTMVVDDGARLSEYPVGLVLNQNGYADAARYRGPTPDGLLMGLPYVLLRREFKDVPDRGIRGRARRLLVTFGGGDPTGMTLRALQAIEELPSDVLDGLEVRVIVGAANDATEGIASFADASRVWPRIAVDRALDNMAEAMIRADLAITSGGSTVWELARTGCPSLVVGTVPGENALTAWLDAVGLFDYIGPADNLDTSQLAVGVIRRLRDAKWRARTALKAQELVDGHGAERVVDALAGLDAR
jgi:spore coat polysaccharide biosynthesis predicted glycosyltransferase SpsG